MFHYWSLKFKWCYIFLKLTGLKYILFLLNLERCLNLIYRNQIFAVFIVWSISGKKSDIKVVKKRKKFLLWCLSYIRAKSIQDWFFNLWQKWNKAGKLIVFLGEKIFFLITLRSFKILKIISLKITST